MHTDVLWAVAGRLCTTLLSVPRALCTGALPPLQQAHRSSPLYWRDTGKSKDSGARLPDSYTMPVDHNCVRLAKSA